MSSNSIREALTRRTVPFVPQLTPTDCGAASLASVLSYFQKDVPIHEIRSRLGGGRNGVTAKQILTVARGYGFSARGVQITPDKLSLLPVGSILHWDLSHFVVFGGLLRKDQVRIVDPGIGVRTLSLSEVASSLSGVALVFEPGAEFVKQKAKRSGRYKRYARWIFGVRDVWSRVLLASLALQLIALSLPALTGLIVDKVVPRVDVDLLSLVAAVFLSVSSFYFLSTFLRARVLLALRTKVEVKISFDFLEHLLDLPYAFFQQRTTGDLIMRMSSQAVIRELLTTGALSALLDGALVVIYLVLLMIAAPWLAAIAVVVAVLQGLLFAVAGKRNARMMVESLSAQSQLEAYQVEMLSGIETIKSMGATDRAHARWSNLYVDALNRSIVRSELEGTFGSLLGTLRFIGPVALMLVGAYQVLNGQLTLGVMLSLSSLGSGFLDPVANLVSTAMTLSQLKGYLERIEAGRDTPRERGGGDHDVQTSEPAAVTVEDVSFSYASEPQPTLRGVSLTIEAGQCVAIVGGSGAGKSTLARLLAGLYEPASGSIAFDGVDLPRWNLAALRDRLGIVTQDTRLFSGSLLENVRLFDRSITEDAVVRACQLACLHDAITEMPMAYDTMLSDGGSSLSGGQRQRLSLARALVRRPRVLVLDEATSALDTITERQVQLNLRRLNCTRVIVAHRLSTIAEADRIVVLSAGKVVAQGTHAELLDNSADYRALVSAQGGAVPADITPSEQTQTNLRPRGLPPLRNISAFGGPRVVPPNMRS
ncbi:MAG: peptidase domain-containing ABC transporter [Polyangiales bacterium]